MPLEREELGLRWYDRFPFREGVPLDEEKLAEHADGSFTAEKSLPFVFAAGHSQWQDPKLKAMQFEVCSGNIVTVDFATGAATFDWERSVFETIHALYNYGAVVIKGIVPHKTIDEAAQIIDAQAPYDDTIQVKNILTSSPCFAILADPTVMTLCDGVIGNQVESLRFHSKT